MDGIITYIAKKKGIVNAKLIAMKTAPGLPALSACRYRYWNKNAAELCMADCKEAINENKAPEQQKKKNIK